MLTPGDGSDFLQVIDVRDLSRFTRTVIENDLSGAFNLSGPRFTWTDFVKILGVQNPVWVPAEIIASKAVTEYQLPLYRAAGSVRSGLMHVDNGRAVKAGLTLTAPEVTARDTRAWISGRQIVPLFPPELEENLIRISRGKASG